MTTETITAQLIVDTTPKGWVLKSFKEIKSMSEETLCFSARLYIAGKFACDVSNHGHGGPDYVTWASPEMYTLALDAVKDHHEFSPSSNFEIAVAEMCIHLSRVKDVKRVCKRGAFPIGVYMEEGHYGSIFGLRSLDNLGKFLAEYKASKYEVFHLT